MPRDGRAVALVRLLLGQGGVKTFGRVFACRDRLPAYSASSAYGTIRPER